MKYAIYAFAAGVILTVGVGFLVLRPVYREYDERDSRRAERIDELEQELAERERAVDRKSRELGDKVERARERSAELRARSDELEQRNQELEERLHNLTESARKAREQLGGFEDGITGDRELAEAIAERARRIQEIAADLDRAIQE